MHQQNSEPQFPSRGPMPPPSVRTESVPPFLIEPSVVFAPTSFFHDRAIPHPDIIQLPRKIMPEGTVTAEYIGHATRTTHFPKLRLRRMKDLIKRNRRDTPIDLGKKLAVDLRSNSPQNWSHLLNHHVPLFAFAQASAGAEGEHLSAVFPADMPRFGRAALELLGIPAVFSDGPVTARFIKLSQSHENVHRPRSRDWYIMSGISKRKSLSEVGQALPKRVLIARRGPRSIMNQAEIEATLAVFGFTTVYSESLPVTDQFRLFSQCETIVAIHGAGIAPLLLRTDALPTQLNLVELIPCGIASDFFRMMAQQVGARWVGVRGKAKPEYLKPAYDLRKSFFNEFQNDDVEVEPNSLIHALGHIWHAEDHRIAPTEPYPDPHLLGVP